MSPKEKGMEKQSNYYLVCNHTTFKIEKYGDKGKVQG